MRVIVAGGREFSDYDLLKRKLDTILLLDRIPAVRPDIEIVSGSSFGADLLGEVYAIERGFKLKRFPADWSLGKKAGPIRNRQMAEYATHCIAFWDGRSRGTKSMIDIAKEFDLPLRIIGY